MNDVSGSNRYSSAWFEWFHVGIAAARTDGVSGTSTPTPTGRLFTRLDYRAGGADEFEFQTFTAAEMVVFAASTGLTMHTACTDFDAAVPPSADKPRVQFALERL